MPSPKRRRPKKYTKFFFLAASLLIFVIILSKLFLVSIFSVPQVLSSQEITQTTTLDGILIKDEKVVKSPSNGMLRLVVPDGRRLEMGGKAAEIVSAVQDIGEVTYDIYTDSTGILCSHLDGYESTLSPQNIGVLEMPVIEKTADKPLSDGAGVDKGQPVFKIIDNLSPVSVYGAIPKSALPDGYLEKRRSLQASWENLNLSITPGDINDTGDNLEGFYLLSDFPESIIHHRKVKITVTTRVLKGFLVPEKAIVYRDSKPGIYHVVKKKALWKPVEIEGELSGKVAVSGDGIEEGARFVSNPVLVREGWPVE
ncbi:HlyD family efflux transporter periplasmic adaptor subunit [Pelotomaculum propionicicum]|uniref:HlyD family efflux transporter periplasmic adaptor subunit n=1 Tax=Pelotomaculum propionicicum TaxID=258475 RepID=UPI003B782A89